MQGTSRSKRNTKNCPKGGIQVKKLLVTLLVVLRLNPLFGGAGIRTCGHRAQEQVGPCLNPLFGGAGIRTGPVPQNAKRP